MSKHTPASLFFELRERTMSHGWVLNWRKIEEWEWYTTPHMAHLFQHLIRRANHEPRKWQGINIDRGQVITSLASLKAQTGISTRTLRTCLERLKSTGEIANESTNQYRLITICNYSSYQDKQIATDKQSDKPPDKQPTSNRQATDNKQQL